MKRAARSMLCAGAAGFFLSSCTSFWAHAISERVADDFLSLQSYRGTTVERGLLPGGADTRVVKEVLYQKPWRLRTTVLAPAERAGDLVIFDRGTVTMHWPNERAGMRIRGVAAPSEALLRAHLRRQSERSLQHYTYSRWGAQAWAKQYTQRWHVRPKVKGQHRYAHSVWMHKAYSIPMKVQYFDDSGSAWYELEFEDVDFGIDVPESAFEFEFPANTVVFDIDLTDKGVTEEQARRETDFEVQLPKRLPEGHRMQKFVVSHAFVPILTVLMNRGATWLSLTESRHLGGELAPIGKAVDVGGASGYLTFHATHAAVVWIRGNTRLTLIGNLPFGELIDVAASVR